MTDQPSIAELFARDPLKLTRENRDQIVTHYRDARKKYLLGDKQAGNTKAKPKSAKAVALEEAKKAAGPLDISDLL